jgi:hypothetical protein
MVSKFIALALLSAAVYAQEQKPVIDNERVTVWDVTWTKGTTNPARGHDHDAVVLWTAGPRAKTVHFSPKGSPRLTHAAEGSRSLIIELKDHPVPPDENKTGYPLAFPRPHVKKLLENDRVIAWSYRWNPGEPTPMHFHDKDVVVVYLEPTALVSTTPDGKKTLNEYKAFDIRFNLGNRAHTESLDHGTGSAMMLELK